MLTQGLERAEAVCRVDGVEVVGEVRRREGRNSWRKVEEGASGRLGGAGRLVVLLRGSHRGQGGRGTTGGGESLRRRDSSAATSGAIPARQWRRPRETSSGKFLGLTWSCCDARPGLRCGRAAQPRRHGGAAARRWLGLETAAAGWGLGSRGAERYIGRLRRSWGGVPRMEGPPGISA